MAMANPGRDQSPQNRPECTANVHLWTFDWMRIPDQRPELQRGENTVAFFGILQFSPLANKLTSSPLSIFKLNI